MQGNQDRPFNFLVVDDSEFARKSLIKVLAGIGGRLRARRFQARTGCRSTGR